MAKSKSGVVTHFPDQRRQGSDPESSVRTSWRPIQFFREVAWELKRVRWPGRHEVVTYTAAALITCLIMGLLVWGFDIGIAKLLSLIKLV